MGLQQPAQDNRKVAAGCSIMQWGSSRASAPRCLGERTATTSDGSGLSSCSTAHMTHLVRTGVQPQQANNYAAVAMNRIINRTCFEGRTRATIRVQS